jgi:hypothetical protein
MSTNYKSLKKPADLENLDSISELEQFDLDSLYSRHKAISLADYRSERGEVVAALLGKAAKDANDLVCEIYAERLKACADRTNYYYTEEFFNCETGETFTGFSNLFGCGLKLCQNCVARAAANHRRIARQVLKHTKLIRRKNYHHAEKRIINELERYRFVTFTMPEFSASFVETLDVQKRAWDLFRKLKFTKHYFSAYIKSIEFTIRENHTYYDHIHLLSISLFVPEKELKAEWTNCVRTAFAEFGIEFTAQQANVNVMLVVDKANPNDKKLISFESALQETCKYITKSDSWEKIPAEHLLEVARIPRWARMFEVVGRFRETLKELNAEKLLTSSSSVGEEASSKVTEGDNLRESAYLDTKGVIDGEALEASEIPEETCSETAEKNKRISWRQLCVELGREKYLEIFYKQVEYAVKIRKLKLLLKYPLAEFKDLDGKAWNLIELEEFALQLCAKGIDLGF